MQKIIRMPEVLAKTAVSRSTIERLVKQGTFPAPIRLAAGKAIGWLEAEVDTWLADRVASQRFEV